MKFAFVDAEKASHPVTVLCSVLDVSRSGYYAWRARPVSSHQSADAQLAVAISTSHKKSRCTYGSPRVHRDLRAGGILVGKKRVER